MLPKAEREKAMATAFKKAVQQADDIAKAAGITRGSLVGVAGGCTGQGEIGENNFIGHDPSGENAIMRRLLSQQKNDDSEDAKYKTMSANPGMLRFNCIVNAVFKSGTEK